MGKIWQLVFTGIHTNCHKANLEQKRMLVNTHKWGF